MTDLATTQRWMHCVISDHDGVDAGLARAAAAVDPRAAESIVRGSATLSSRERLELYRRSYQARLTGCLRESYPALAHALGAELFCDFALDYLRARPPRGYTLATLGADWPAHLAATRPDGDLPPGEREPWPDFLVDLATLERTFLEVYDGPGVEGEALPAITDLPAPGAPLARWDAARVTPVVCLRLVSARFDVAAYLVAVRAGQDPPLPTVPAPCRLAVSRRDYVVTITHLDAGGDALLRALAGGARVAVAAEGAGLERPAAWRLLRAWAERGLIAAIRADAPFARSKRGRVSP